MKKKLFAVLLAVVLVASVSTIAFASYNDEPFEPENYYTYGGSKDGTFTLTYIGIGGGRCDSNDRRFQVNINRSYPGSDWKYYSGNSRYQNTPTGRVPYGYNLDGPGGPHICVGAQEFSVILHPFSYWTTSGVESNVYTWRR